MSSVPSGNENYTFPPRLILYITPEYASLLFSFSNSWYFLYSNGNFSSSSSSSISNSSSNSSNSGSSYGSINRNKVLLLYRQLSIFCD